MSGSKWQAIPLVGGLLIAVCFFCAASAKEPVADYHSPLALQVDSEAGRLYVAEATADQVAVVDVESEKVIDTYALPGPPGGLALSGDTLYATIASPAGRVAVIDLDSGEVTSLLPVGHTPTVPVLSPDGKTLYVCNRFDNDVSVVELATGQTVARVPVLREPVAAVLSADGSNLFVANHLPEGPADAASVFASVSVMDTRSREVTSNIALPNGSTDLRGMCISPDGKHVYVTHILARFQLPTTQLERGWMNTNALSVIDAREKNLINTVLLDNVDRGAANPWGVACSPDGDYVCVSHAGTHEVSVIDRSGLHERLAKAAAGEEVTQVTSSAEDVPNDLAFLVGIRRRMKLDGYGPRGVAVMGTKVYAAQYFSDSIGVVDAGPDVRHHPRSLALGKQKELTSVRRGELYFNDARFCFQGWQSCATCHPDVRADGLNWDLLNDGIGNPRNTKSLLLAHETPPAMVTGVRASAEMAVRAGIRYIQFAVRPEEDAVDIDNYLKSLQPVPSPHLVDGKLSAAAGRGKEVFEKAGCARCHPGPLYTDMKMHDVGTGASYDNDRPFDTPALVEVWRTGPYLVRGQADTMLDVLVECNEDDRHGETSDLSERELADLVEYILSL